jgi:hypothetical protein
LLLSLKEPAHTCNIDVETHARGVEEKCCGKRATASIEPSQTTMRRWQTTVAANWSDPGFAPARDHMNNEGIQPSSQIPITISI